MRRSISLWLFVIMDDYSKYTSVLFLTHKSETIEAFKRLCWRITIEKNISIGVECCEKKVINHQLSPPETRQQNGVMERRNVPLIKMIRTLLNDQNLPHKFWAKAINTTCYNCNKYLPKPPIGKITNEFYCGKSPSISHIRCLVLYELYNGKIPLISHSKYLVPSDIFISLRIN